MTCRPIITTIPTNCFVVKGVRYIFLDGVCRMLNPGDIILIKPYQTHYMQSLSSDFYARYVLNFAPDYLDEMLKPAEKQRFWRSCRMIFCI